MPPGTALHAMGNEDDATVRGYGALAIATMLWGFVLWANTDAVIGLHNRDFARLSSAIYVLVLPPLAVLVLTIGATLWLRPEGQRAPVPTIAWMAVALWFPYVMWEGLLMVP
jgi:hypothetical protein